MSLSGLLLSVLLFAMMPQLTSPAQGNVASPIYAYNVAHRFAKDMQLTVIFTVTVYYYHLQAKVKDMSFVFQESYSCRVL